MKLSLFKPPIFDKINLLKYIYYKYFKREFIQGSFIFKRQKYDRRALISSVIFKKINAQGMENVNYLEIGCDKDGTFNSIPLLKINKVGVDPISGGTERVTSDIFFQNNERYFDVIFIDGLHTYKQVKKDFENSLKFLKKGGHIFIDDMLPYNWSMQHNPRIKGKWTGDVWKLAVEIYDSQLFSFDLFESNYGIGVVQNTKNINQLPDKDYQNKSFSEYLHYRKNLFKITDIENFIRQNMGYSN